LCGSGAEKYDPFKMIMIKPKNISGWTFYYKKIDPYHWNEQNDSMQIVLDTTLIEVEEYSSKRGPAFLYFLAVRDSDRYCTQFEVVSCLKQINAMFIDSIETANDTSIVHFRYVDPLQFPQLQVFKELQKKEETNSTITTVLFLTFFGALLMFLIRHFR
jgi:hypothetical protein